MIFIIVDIDGTIANSEHRVHFLKQKKKDWNSFYESCDKDEGISEVISIVENMHDAGYNIIFCTGRPEKYRDKTTLWLASHLDVTWDHLLMRKNGDYRADWVVKPELLLKHSISPKKVWFILEDRNQMVKKWRDLGYTCFQVAEGDF